MYMGLGALSVQRPVGERSACDCSVGVSDSLYSAPLCFR